MRRKTILILIGCVLATTGLTGPSATLAADQGSAEKELIKIERDWCSANVKGDVPAVSAILADDYADITLTGQVVNKTQALADVKTDRATVCEIDMLHVRVYGDAAVAIGRTTGKSSSFNGHYMYTDVYIRRDGRWTCVSSQGTEIKK